MIAAVLARMDKPLFLLERRRQTPANFLRRKTFHAFDTHTHKEVVRKVANGQDELNGQLRGSLPVINFFKLTAIVAAGVSPFLIVLMLFINGQMDKKIAEHRDAGFKEADARYVPQTLYDLRRQELISRVDDMQKQIADLRVHDAAREASLSRLEQGQTEIRVLLTRKLTGEKK